VNNKELDSHMAIIQEIVKKGCSHGKSTVFDCCICALDCLEEIKKKDNQ